MAITWRNVDVPQGLNLAAGQVQQSFKDVANSLKDVGQNFVDMKSNDAMAALEARLAQEQQLSNVDQMAAMDAGQLRGATSGWIDTKQAREQILGRQGKLVQGVEGQFNQALASNDMDQAAQIMQQLRGRAGYDATGLVNQFNQRTRDTNVAQARQLLQEGNFDGASSYIKLLSQDPTFDSSGLIGELNQAQFGLDLDAAYQTGNFKNVNATTAQQRESLRQAQLQNRLNNNDIEGSKQFARTAQEFDVIQQRAGKIALDGMTSGFSQSYSNILSKTGKDFDDSYADFSKKAMKQILGMPAELQGEALQRYGMFKRALNEEAVQRMSLPAGLQEQHEAALNRADFEIQKTVIEPMRLEAEQALREVKNLSAVMASRLPSANKEATPATLASAVSELSKLGVDTTDITRMLREVDTSNYRLGTVIDALVTTDLERGWFGFGYDKQKENFETRLKALDEQGDIDSQLELQLRQRMLNIDLYEKDLQGQVHGKLTSLVGTQRGKRRADEGFGFNVQDIVAEAREGLARSNPERYGITSMGRGAKPTPQQARNMLNTQQAVARETGVDLPEPQPVNRDGSENVNYPQEYEAYIQAIRARQNLNLENQSLRQQQRSYGIIDGFNNARSRGALQYSADLGDGPEREEYMDNSSLVQRLGQGVGVIAGGLTNTGATVVDTFTGVGRDVVNTFTMSPQEMRQQQIQNLTENDAKIGSKVAQYRNMSTSDQTLLVAEIASKTGQTPTQVRAALLKQTTQ